VPKEKHGEDPSWKSEFKKWTKSDKIRKNHETDHKRTQDIIYTDPKLLPRYAPLVQLVKLFGGDPSLSHTLTALPQPKAPLVLAGNLSLGFLKKLTSGIIEECVLLLSAQPDMYSRRGLAVVFRF
jgi:hypothetical protein